MNVTVEIPDELASQMSASGADLPRRVLEAFALEEYKAERISKVQLRRLLGFETMPAKKRPLFLPWSFMPMCC